MHRLVDIFILPEVGKQKLPALESIQKVILIYRYIKFI